MNLEKNKSNKIRKFTQLAMFILVSFIAISNWLLELDVSFSFLPDISLHATCPFGGVASIYEFFTTGSFIQKIHNSSFILMILGIIVAIFFGSIFCGYFCPFGTFQEWTSKIGKKIFGQKYNHFVPQKLDAVLRYLRYIVLGLVLYQSAVTTQLVFSSVDPYYALFHFFTGEVAITAYIALGVIILLSLFIERPWCKYFCPYGALLGLFNPIRIFKVRRNTQSCIHCKKCDEACPMNIEVSKKTTIYSPQCISCYRCTSEVFCPVKNTVSIVATKEGASHES